MARATTGLSYLTFGLVVLGSFVFSVFVTVPQWNNFKKVSAQLDREMQREADREAFLVNLDARASEMERYKNEAKVMAVALPDRFTQSELWVNINAAASSAGVVLTEVGGSEVEKKINEAAAAQAAADGITSSETLMITKTERWDTPLTVKGNYSQIRAFIKSLEDSLVLSDLKDINIEKSADSLEKSDELTAKFTVSTYVQPLALSEKQ